MAGKAGAVRAGRAFVELFADNTRLVRGLRNAQRKLRAFGSFARSTGAKLVGGVALLTAPLAAAVKLFINMGDQLDKISARTGITVEKLSELKFAAEQSGSSIEDLEKGTAAFGRFMVDLEMKSSTALFSLKKLGLTMADLEGKTPDERISLLLKALDKVEDPSIKAGLAMKVLGRAGRALLPMAAHFEELAAEARKFGIIMTKEDATAAAQLTDDLNLMRSVMKMIFAQVGSALVPMLIKGSKWIAEMGAKVIKWVKANKPLIVTIVKILGVIAAAGVAFITAGVAASLLSAIIGLMITAWTAFGVVLGVVASLIAFLLSPIGLVVTALAGLVAWLVDWGAVTKKVTKKAGEEWEGFRDRALGAWGGIRDAIAAGDLGLAFRIVTLFLKGEWLRIMGTLKAKWGEFVGFFQSIWATAVFGAARVFTNAFAGIKKFWFTVTGALADGWNLFIGFIQRTWNSTIGFIKKAWEGLKELVTGKRGRSSKSIDEETDKANAAINRRVVDKLNAAERERKAKLDSIERQRKGTLAALDAEQKRREDARKSGSQKDIEENDAALAAARQALKDAIIEAARKRKEKEDKDKKTDDDKKDDFKPTGKALGDKAGIEGTITGFDRLAFGREDEIVKILKKIEKNQIKKKGPLLPNL